MSCVCMDTRCVLVIQLGQTSRSLCRLHSRHVSCLAISMAQCVRYLCGCLALGLQPTCPHVLAWPVLCDCSVWLRLVPQRWSARETSAHARSSGASSGSSSAWKSSE
jgi:hypothetical protein